MCTWYQGDLFLAGQESRECYIFISDIGIRGIYLSLTLGTAKFKQLDDLSAAFKMFPRRPI